MLRLTIKATNGEIAQRVAFVCHGNAFLAGAEIPDLLATNSACQFCQSMTFQGIDGSLASTPNEWLQALRSESVRGLRLAQSPRNDTLYRTLTEAIPDAANDSFRAG